MRAVLLVPVVVALMAGPAMADCRLTEVLAGQVKLEPLAQVGQAVVQNASMAPGEHYGAIRGTIVRSREGFIILNRDGARVGMIDIASGRVKGEGDDDCTSKMVVRYAAPAAGMLLNDGTPIGTIDGALPR